MTVSKLNVPNTPPMYEEAGCGCIFQDRQPQGCGRRAYRDVFTACPGKYNHILRKLLSLCREAEVKYGTHI
jgi:hypothetical protein